MTADYEALAALRAEYAVSHYSRFFPEAMFSDVLTVLAAFDAEKARADAAVAEVERLRGAFERANIAVSVREDEIGALRERVKHAEGYCIARDDAQHCEHWWDGEPCCDCHRGDWERVTAERDAAVAVVARVRALHTETQFIAGAGVACKECMDVPPCATIRALDGAES